MKQICLAVSAQMTVQSAAMMQVRNPTWMEEFLHEDSLAWVGIQRDRACLLYTSDAADE